MLGPICSEEHQKDQKAKKSGIGWGVGGSKGVKSGKKYQKHNLFVLLTPFDPPYPHQSLFLAFLTFLKLSPTNRSQNFENRTKNECSTDFFVKLPKSKKILKLVKLW
ncbi:unnamed protein product, partial [Meganyctiphanes norvegica]